MSPTVRRPILLLAAVALCALGAVTARAADPTAAPPVAAAPAVDSTLAADSAAAVPAVAPDYLARIRAEFTPENRAYAKKRATLSLIEPLVAILMSLILLVTGLSARMRDVAHRISGRRYVRVLVYLTLSSLVLFVLGFPLEWYQGFALEHQFGLSTQPFGGWLREQGISLLVSIVMLGVVPLLALAYMALEKQPRRWWLWLAIGTLPVILTAIVVSPYVEFLYNDFKPLRDQQLKQEIVSLAEKAGIPGRNVYEVDKSRQTKKFNAYVGGFGVSQRIVLWDTTLKGMEKDEILFVMGHEMGHYVLRHIWKTVLALAALSFALFWLAARLLEPLVARFGPRWGFTQMHDIASLPLLSIVLTVVSFVAQPAMNGISRTMEHESDIFGLEVTHSNDAAARAFIKLGSQNKSDPEPPAWRVWLYYSHPPLAERVRFATEYRPWESGQPNRLFRPKDAH
jgi:STE24 endopeptidase